MEDKIYKMIYLGNTDKILKDKIKYPIKEQTIIEELASNKIRILGHDFVKNNKNKAKLIINNKKHKLEEFININKNIKEFGVDKLKIGIILYNGLSNISCFFKIV